MVGLAAAASGDPNLPAPAPPRHAGDSRAAALQQVYRVHGHLHPAQWAEDVTAVLYGAQPRAPLRCTTAHYGPAREVRLTRRDRRRGELLPEQLVACRHVRAGRQASGREDPHRVVRKYLCAPVCGFRGEPNYELTCTRARVRAWCGRAGGRAGCGRRVGAPAQLHVGFAGLQVVRVRGGALAPPSASR